MAKAGADAPADPGAIWKGRKGPPDSTVSMALHLNAAEAANASVAAAAPATAYHPPPSAEPPKDKPTDPKDKPSDAKD